MQNVREEIRGWLEEVFGTQEEAGGVSIISLLHIDGYGREVDIFNVKTGGPKWGDVPAMSDVLYRFADRHSRNLPGAQSFKLQAMFGSENRPLRYLPIQMTGALAFGALPGGGMATEPPTATGQLQQVMRLTEQAHQLAHTTQQHNVQTLERIIEGLRSENLAYKRENAELWIAAKDLIVDMLKMRHDTRMGELAAARAAEFQRQVMALAPALINMMSGREIFPQAISEPSLLDGLAAGANPDQIRMAATFIAANFEGGDKLSALLLDHYNKYHEKKNRQAVEEKRLLNSTPGIYDTGERDAAGDAIRVLRGGSAKEVEKQLPAPGSVMKALNSVLERDEVEGTDSNGAKTNGAAAAVASNADTPAKPTNADTPGDTAILESLFNELPQLDMALGFLEGTNPELAARLKVRLATMKKS